MQELTVHVARQPIFDVNLNVVGYELLFRSNLINTYTGTDGDRATQDVIANSFLLIGIETLTNGKRAFINFTANSLKNNIAAMLSKELVAIEILEDITPDEKIIHTCRKLKRDGYVLVLDDFVFKREFLPLIELADIIKIDFRATPHAERQQLIQHLQRYPIKFLAEKIETHDEFKEAIKLGFTYFQGYFFCKPLVISGKNLPGYKVNYLHILQEINRPELELKQIETIIRRDVSLSYKLLRFINSPLFGFKNKISSLQQALALLGHKEITKWVSLIALQGIGKDKPGELILRSLIRARFAENLAAIKMPRSQISNAFLMGMFSHIDVLLDRPLHSILSEIPLDEKIKQALLDIRPNQFSILHKLIQAYEKGYWELHSCYADKLELNERDVLKSYREALIWAHDLIMKNN